MFILFNTCCPHETGSVNSHDREVRILSTKEGILSEKVSYRFLYDYTLLPF